MSLKLSSLKKWLTLEDSAKYLSLALGEPVETKDLIQLSLENSLALSVLLPDTVMAVKYRHNPHAHEPEPPMPSERDISGLLSRLDLMARLSWAAFLDEKTVFEPDFEEVRHASGLWGLPCLERSNNITLLGGRLKSALTQTHISHEAKPGFGPIIIQNSITDELWGLVKFSYDSFEEGDSDRKPSRKDYAPICELPESAHIGVSQTELQRFIGALQAAESTTEPDPDRQHYPQQLEALTIAWRKYWQNADPTDRTACPKKGEVKAWLMEPEQGFSAKNADAGATIIKPQWAIDKGW